MSEPAPQAAGEGHLAISDTGRLRDAMQRLRSSGRGLICVIGAEGTVVGVISDGDIRNALLEHADMDVPVTNHMTRKFAFAYEGATKEQVLKLFSGRIRQVPILDRQHRLVTIAGPGYLYLPGSVFARAKAPARLSLAGGGTDFTDYFVKHGGVSLSTTIARYAHVAIRKRGDRKIILHSADQNEGLEVEDASKLVYGTPFDLIAATIKVMRPDFGLEIHCGTDFGPRSGLGGSAALLSAVIGCLNEFREEQLDDYSIAEHSFEVERVELGIPGGWQDQYATVFGGFNYIEFDDRLNSVMPLRLSAATVSELEARLLLCHTGREHLGGAIQHENSRRGDAADQLAFGERVKEIARAMKTDLLRGRLNDLGAMLHETWELKKSLVAESSSLQLDAIYDAARRAGADGGRLMGTGGGGYFLFCVKPFERYQVWRSLTDRGLAVESVVLDTAGMKSWTSRS